MAAALTMSGVAELVERARTAYPEFGVNPDAFAAHLYAKAGDDPGAVNVEDLYLAFASAHGDRNALALIEQRHLAQIGRFIAHLRMQPSFVDEVRQQVRERILIGTATAGPRVAKILDYSGRGPLGAWIRVTAMRQALDLIEKEKPHRPGPDEL